MEPDINDAQISGHGTVDISSLTAALGVDLGSLNLATPGAAGNMGWARVPDAVSFPEDIDQVDFENLPVLAGENLCDYCDSIPFQVLGLHGKIRMEDFDSKFPRERHFAAVLATMRSCFFCQKIALLSHSWKLQKAKDIPMSKLG
jgi:hypothetical protein